MLIQVSLSLCSLVFAKVLCLISSYKGLLSGRAGLVVSLSLLGLLLLSHTFVTAPFVL